MTESYMIEIFMYQVGQLFLLPVLGLVVLLFAYALYALGGFAVQAWQRRKVAGLRGFPLLDYAEKCPGATDDELDLFAHKLLEPERLASRIAPMLGLVGTNVILLTEPRLTDIGRGPTFYDCLVQVALA